MASPASNVPSKVSSTDPTSCAPRFETLTVILVSYNSRDILRQTAPPLRDLAHVVIVDNASDDDTVAVAQALLPNSTVHASPVNLGFGRANNVALEQATTPFALLLNPDCRFDPAMVQRLLDAAARYPNAAILAPCLHDARGKAQVAYDGPFWQRGGPPYLEPSGDLCADFLPGAALLLRLERFRDVGYFDPAIFMYYEDDDLCLRLRRAGHALVLVQDATLEHLVGQSSRRTLRLLHRKYFHEMASRLYVWSKYRGRAPALKLAAKLALTNLLKLPLFALTFNGHMTVRSLGRVQAALKAFVRIKPRGDAA